MIQRWLASTRHRAARDPYFLFAASNGGSLLGLLAYPFVLEPLLGLDDQGRVWSVAYAVAIALVAASAVALWLQPAERSEETAPRVAEDDAAVDWRRRLTWLALAAVPSSLMLGVTSYLTRDISPIPLLWVLPLALYLLTFIVAFSPWTERHAAHRYRAHGAAGGRRDGGLHARDPDAGAPGRLLLVHLIGLAVVGLLCHGRLAADRPSPAHLTEFYLWLALGGALGGAFNAVVAPLVFPSVIEYPLAIVAACLLRPRPPSQATRLPRVLVRQPEADARYGLGRAGAGGRWHGAGAAGRPRRGR